MTGGLDRGVHTESMGQILGLLVGTMPGLMLTIAEEIEDAGKALPQSIMWSVYLNSGMGLIMAITLCFCLGDEEDVLKTETGYPFIQIFFNATKSHAATDVMVSIIIITIVFSAISVLATASRQLWSFARDKGLPFSGWFATVSRSQRLAESLLIPSE